MAATARPSSKARAAARLTAMALWLGVCVVVHLLVRPFGPSPWPRRLLRGVGWLAGARVTVKGPLPPPGTLVVANHVSWLDIPMLAGAANCAFVAKDGLKGHPVMHWLCEQNGTVFVDRDRRGSVAEQVEAMARALGAGRPLVLFPEGTVSDGTRLLPFRSSLLALAEQPEGTPAVVPAAIDYHGAASEFGWPAGETGQANFVRLLGRRGTVAVTLHFLEALPPGLGRKRLARECHDAIAAALAPSGVAPAGV